MNKVQFSAFGLLLFCLPLAFLACASSPAAASAADARAAADSALNRMDGGGAAQQGSPSQGVSVNTSRSKPAWVDSLESAYPRRQYVAAQGYGSSRELAERNSLSNLIAFFGQSIKADQTISNTYQEAVKSGVAANWSENTAIQNTISTSSSMDTLVGAEIKEVWYDAKNTYYAVAVMERAKTIQIYSDIIKANIDMINNLITMTTPEKNSLEGYTRYQFAATVADMNTSYGNLLKVIDAVPPDGMKPGTAYRAEAAEIVKAIPVGITVKNDKSGRIQGAFAKVIADAGFRSGGTNSRYVLAVDVNTAPAEYPNQSVKYTRIEITANLTDTSFNAVLVPYNMNGREGHATQSEADNRAYSAAEKKISEEYRGILANYLSQLLPKK